MVHTWLRKLRQLSFFLFCLVFNSGELGFILLHKNGVLVSSCSTTHNESNISMKNKKAIIGILGTPLKVRVMGSWP